MCATVEGQCLEYLVYITLDVPRKENKILGQTLNKSIDRIGAQQEKKKILGQTWQENINPGCAQKEK